MLLKWSNSKILSFILVVHATVVVKYLGNLHQKGFSIFSNTNILQDKKPFS